VGDLRYADAGVDIDEGNRAVALIKRTVASTFTSGVLGGLGSFSGLFALDTGRHRQPVLVASADGVGTKIKVAIATGNHRVIGGDIVNHCVNDIATAGARPLFFLDYFATGKLEPAVFTQLIEGMTEACRAAGCALLGGETAEMPGVYALGDYDLAGFIVGLVEADARREPVHAGDVLVGLRSAGLHTNGYSLARKVFEGVELTPDLSAALMAPHLSYLADMRRLRWKAAAHITGGGILGNLPRALPDGLAAVVRKSAWKPNPIFEEIRRRGPVSDDEMWGTFNMGIGMILVMDRNDVPEGATVVGEVVQQAGPERVDIR
jgi:phosphoribosylformylglycinamidine cyclo-ligase